MESKRRNALLSVIATLSIVVAITSGFILLLCFFIVPNPTLNSTTEYSATIKKTEIEAFGGALGFLIIHTEEFSAPLEFHRSQLVNDFKFSNIKPGDEITFRIPNNQREDLVSKTSNMDSLDLAALTVNGTVAVTIESTVAMRNTILKFLGILTGVAAATSIIIYIPLGIEKRSNKANQKSDFEKLLDR